jgi:uncharacterized protein YjbJ (UPF0337 family)
MDKDRVKGTINEAVGSAKRHVGNLTGDTKTQVEGAVQQVKGKVQNAWGKTKDAARDAQANLKASNAADEEAARKNRKVIVPKVIVPEVVVVERRI